MPLSVSVWHHVLGLFLLVLCDQKVKIFLIKLFASFEHTSVHNYIYVFLTSLKTTKAALILIFTENNEDDEKFSIVMLGL